jgi:5-methylcytosine-specific restriction endonuclease McrA
MCRKWAKEHPEEMRIIIARRRALAYGAEGNYTKYDVLTMLEAQKNKCAACGKGFEDTGFHVDHVFPLSKGGKNSPDNLQLLCPSCNRSKSDKLPGEWRAAA